VTCVHFPADLLWQPGLLRRWAGVALAGSVIVACEGGGAPAATPTASEIQPYYEYEGELSVEMSGNVARVAVVIGRDEYRMGGRVWAMASPYIFLFSAATQRVFQDFPGLGGVRVIVQYPDGSILAQALLGRGELSDVTWQRALNIAGNARTQGTESPGFMRDLVRYGEEHTEFEYNPQYIQLP